MNAPAQAQNEDRVSAFSATAKKLSGKQLHTTDEYAADPHKAILDFVSPFLDQVEVSAAMLLVATYRQNPKSAGGVIMTDNYQDEDKYQGITGLVLKVGPLCFTDERNIKFGNFKAVANDWVVYKAENGQATELRGLHCRFIEDVNICGVVKDPELLW